MKLYFDKNLETAKELEIKNLYTNPIAGKVTASNNIEITSSADFPDLSQFYAEPYFTTVEAKDGDIVIPLQGTFNHIADLNTNYYAQDAIYNINITLNYESPV